MYSACLLAFFTGFLSLSLEILWVRLFSFTNHSLPQSFAFVLTAYLIGIAFGAQMGKWCCKHRSDSLWLITGLVLIVSSVCDLTGPWIYAAYAHASTQLFVAAMIIMLTSALKAVAFPIAHHLGTPTFAVNVGRHVSRVYVSNIFGATLGPIFTGVILLWLISTQQAFVVCALVTLFLSFYCLYKQINRLTLSIATLALTCQFVLVFFGSQHLLMMKLANPIYGDIVHVVENPQGVLVVYAGGKKGDIVTGGNVYDGTTNLDPLINFNRINRVAVLSTIVNHPARVLMIGLSIGSWLKVITMFPGVESIDVVEINPGYLDLILFYPRQLSALLDPRVRLHIDDGRRWLRAHPNAKYDMVVMNSTYHWRAYAGNLLSQEFLRTVKRHMNPGAVFEFNTTNSPDALKTAASVFPHAYLYENFVIAADFDWRKKMHTELAEQKLAALEMDGAQFYPLKSGAVIRRQLNEPNTEIQMLEVFYNSMDRPVEVITDQNLITEYKYGRRLS